MRNHYSPVAQTRTNTPLNTVYQQGKLGSIFVIILLLLTAFGCRAVEKPVKPLAFSVDGAIVTTAQPIIPTIRAYGSSFKTTFDNTASSVPATTSLIVDNVRADAVTVAGVIVVSKKVLSPTSVKYEFRIAPGQYQTASFSVPTGSEYSFAVIGDNRDGREIYTGLVNTFNEISPAFILNGGDLVSSGSESQYKTFMTDSAKLSIPFFTALGNHDIKSDGRMHYNRLLAPDYYDFSWGNARFFVLDNADGKMDEGQLAWLENNLGNRTSEHVFILMHKPTFDPRPGGTHTVDSQELADRLELMAAKYKVTAVFASHIHMYHHSVRLGIPYYITGGAGAPLYTAADAGGIYHYLLVKIAGKEVTIEKRQLKSM